MRTFRPSLLAVLVGLLSTSAMAESADQQQIDQLKQQIQDLETQINALANAETQTSPKLAALEKFSLWGYGEIYYTHPTAVARDTQADLARAVFGIGYEFNENTRFNSEYESEHAVASSSDSGEFEVEQFYVDHSLGKGVGVQTGLFLIPTGLLNESHEPTNFYGVQRNFVETLIIPSTWREGGVALYGDTAAGLHWSAGITTDQDLSKWTFNPAAPSYATALTLQTSGVAPLQATHQEMQFANAQHLAQFLSLNYLGRPGVTLGGSLFSGLASNSANPESGQRITLGETHGRWTPGPWDLSALYARGAISNTGGANALTPGASNPMPAAFYGYFGQAAYTAWRRGDSHLGLFLRAERYNMGAHYEGLAPGFGPVPTGTVVLPDGSTGAWPVQADTVFSLGANYYLTRNVVLKTDYQKFRDNSDFSRFDLGLGLAF